MSITVEKFQLMDFSKHQQKMRNQKSPKNVVLHWYKYLIKPFKVFFQILRPDTFIIISQKIVLVSAEHFTVIFY